MFTIRRCAIVLLIPLWSTNGLVQKPYTVGGIEPQPLLAQALRIHEALQSLGQPLPREDLERLEALRDQPHTQELAEIIQEILDPYCLAMVHIDPEARVKALPGSAPPALMQQGWRSFLIKVHNEAGIRSAVEVDSPNAAPVLYASSGEPRPRLEHAISTGQLDNRFLELKVYRQRPMLPTLSG